MQETFIKAMLSLSENNNIKSWLYKVARNIFIDYYRKNKNEGILDINEINIEDDFDLLNSVITNEINKRLYIEIQNLSLQERELITLYYFGELKQEEISQQLGLSYSSVRTSLYRIRRKLFEKLKED